MTRNYLGSGLLEKFHDRIQPALEKFHNQRKEVSNLHFFLIKFKIIIYYILEFNATKTEDRLPENT